jgi:hypothetical protein
MPSLSTPIGIKPARFLTKGIEENHAANRNFPGPNRKKGTPERRHPVLAVHPIRIETD